MPKSDNQKLKIFYILDYLKENSHQDHPVRAAELLAMLEHQHNIICDRKTVYSDIAALQDYGVDIVSLPGKNGGYYIASRNFELPELKLLIDAVQSSRFLTEKKSRELIEKLCRECSMYDAQLMRRDVLVSGRVKSMNETIYYNVDTIQEAIGQNKQITFRYFDYGVTKERIFRHDGLVYVADPLSLVRNDENYYLVAFDERDRVNKNFRIDKMADITISDEPRDKACLESRFNPAEYSNKVFGMYGGREELVTLECRERLSGVIIDRFGREPSLIKCDFGFRVSLRVMISPNFFAWVLGFGKDMRIVAPEAIRREMLERLRDTMEVYNEKI